VTRLELGGDALRRSEIRPGRARSDAGIMMPQWTLAGPGAPPPGPQYASFSALKPSQYHSVRLSESQAAHWHKPRAHAGARDRSTSTAMSIQPAGGRRGLRH
jgi:hypothetical protein